ncbi:MAG: sigma-70 factor domain-containing protein [Thermodesulfobacteriota bacterium]
MSNKKKEALRVKTAKENIRLLKTESDSLSEAELEKTDYQDESEASESSNKEENGVSSPKYGFPFKSNKENANEYDLIRFYLHEIADHALLSREEEIRIAKKIETGKRIITKTILSSSLMLNEICGIGE